MTGDDMKDGAGTADMYADDETQSETVSGSVGDNPGGEATETAVQADQNQGRPYIMRRTMQGANIEFERPNRIAMFVHDDVADGEDELLAELRSRLNPKVKKMDTREAVYRAALDNQEDVLAELVEMGYEIDE